MALAWWSVLNKQKAVNFGGVKVQILTNVHSSFNNNYALHHELDSDFSKPHVD